MIVRFDDTNPSKEKAEYQESQLADLKTLGVFPDKVTFTSDYFDQIEKLCVELIQRGKAYCDDTPVEQVLHHFLTEIYIRCEMSEQTESKANVAIALLKITSVFSMK